MSSSSSYKIGDKSESTISNNKLSEVKKNLKQQTIAKYTKPKEQCSTRIVN